MINKIQERAPRLILNDNTRDFDWLLQNDDSFRNIKTLMVEICKIKNNLNPKLRTLCLKGEIATLILEIFKSFGRKGKELDLEVLSYPSKHSFWWRRLEDVFRLHFQKTTSRHVQDDLPRRLQNVFKKDVLKTALRQRQDV